MAATNTSDTKNIKLTIKRDLTKLINYINENKLFKTFDKKTRDNLREITKFWNQNDDYTEENMGQLCENNKSLITLININNTNEDILYAYITNYINQVSKYEESIFKHKEPFAHKYSEFEYNKPITVDVIKKYVRPDGSIQEYVISEVDKNTQEKLMIMNPLAEKLIRQNPYMQLKYEKYHNIFGKSGHYTSVYDVINRDGIGNITCVFLSEEHILKLIKYKNIDITNYAMSLFNEFIRNPNDDKFKTLVYGEIEMIQRKFVKIIPITYREISNEKSNFKFTHLVIEDNLTTNGKFIEKSQKLKLLKIINSAAKLYRKLMFDTTFYYNKNNITFCYKPSNDDTLVIHLKNKRNTVTIKQLDKGIFLTTF